MEIFHFAFFQLSHATAHTAFCPLRNFVQTHEPTPPARCPKVGGVSVLFPCRSQTHLAWAALQPWPPVRTVPRNRQTAGRGHTVPTTCTLPASAPGLLAPCKLRHPPTAGPGSSRGHGVSHPCLDVECGREGWRPSSDTAADLLSSGL